MTHTNPEHSAGGFRDCPACIAADIRRQEALAEFEAMRKSLDALEATCARALDNGEIYLCTRAHRDWLARINTLEQEVESASQRMHEATEEYKDCLDMHIHADCDHCDAVKPIDITVGQLGGMCITPDSVTMSLNQYGRNITEAVVAALVDVRDSMAAHERRILDTLSAGGPSPQYAEVIDARRSQLDNCIGWIDLQIAEIRERGEGWE